MYFKNRNLCIYSGIFFFFSWKDSWEIVNSDHLWEEEMPPVACGSSWERDGTWATAVTTLDPNPLNHQENPCFLFMYAFSPVHKYFFLFFFLRAAPAAHGSSQARGQIRAAAAHLHHSLSNMGYEPHLQPTVQLVATPDP